MSQAGNSNKITRDYLDSLLIETRYLNGDNPDTGFTLYGETFSSPVMTAALSHLTQLGSGGMAKGIALGAKEAGCVLSFDPNLRPPLWSSEEKAKEKIAFGLTQCDVLKISDNEIEFMTDKTDLEEGVHDLIRQYQIPLILATYGKDGSKAYYLPKEKRNGAASPEDYVTAFVPGFINPATIETTGAGDTFGGCSIHFVLKYGLDGFDVDKLTELLTFANAAASITTTRKGALCVMPEKQEVLDFIG